MLLTPFISHLVVLIVLFTLFGKKFSLKQKLTIGVLIYIASYASYLAVALLGLPQEIDMATGVFAAILYFYIAVQQIKPKAPDLPIPSKEKVSKKETRTRPKTSHPKQGANIFICYRRADSENVAGRIYDRLVQHYGKEPIFKDVDSIPLGVDFRTFLDEKVGQCQVLLVVIGNQWVTITDNDGNRRLDDFRDYVRIEIESALKRNIPVIPLLVRRAVMPLEEELPSEIKGLAFRNGIQIRPDPDFHNDMERLISAMDVALGE